MVIGRRWTCCGKGQERYRESLRLLCFTELSKSNCGLPPDSEQYSEPRTLDSLCSMMLRPAQCWSFSIILVFVLELCLRMLVPKYGWPVSCSSWLDRSILDIDTGLIGACLTSDWRFMKIAGPNVHTLRHWLRSGAQRHGDWETDWAIIFNFPGKLQTALTISYDLLRVCHKVVCWIHFWLKLYRKGFHAVIFGIWTCLLYLLKDTQTAWVTQTPQNQALWQSEGDHLTSA